MKSRLIILAAVLASYPVITAAGGGSGCATTGEPRVVIQRVEVPIAAPCPDRRNPAPGWVDSLDAIQAAVGRGEIDVAFALAMGGREQRIQYQEESDRQIAACAWRPPDPG